MLRDCQNISDFFSKKLKHNCVMSAEELFMEITGLKLEGKSEAEFMSQVIFFRAVIFCWISLYGFFVIFAFL